MLICILVFLFIYSITKINPKKLFMKCEDLSFVDCSVSFNCHVFDGKCIEDLCLDEIECEFNSNSSPKCLNLMEENCCIDACKFYNIAFNLKSDTISYCKNNENCNYADNVCMMNPCENSHGLSCPSYCLFSPEEDQCLFDFCAEITTKNDCESSSLGCSIVVTESSSVCRFKIQQFYYFD
jgi:hypothetical protein